VNKVAQKKIGKVVHYYGKIGVAIIDLTGPLSKGDEIKISGKGGEFTQVAKSIEIEHKRVDKAKKGDSIGLKVENKVKEEDKVYKVS
jgi:putative protease